MGAVIAVKRVSYNVNIYPIQFQNANPLPSLYGHITAYPTQSPLFFHSH